EQDEQKNKGRQQQTPVCPDPGPLLNLRNGDAFAANQRQHRKDAASQTPNLQVCRGHTGLRALARGRRGLPVLRGEIPVGIVTRTDPARALSRRARPRLGCEQPLRLIDGVFCLGQLLKLLVGRDGIGSVHQRRPAAHVNRHGQHLVHLLARGAELNQRFGM
ncbi:hypothetical protein KXV85_003358, partial [Aspergillus fumigatus]